MNLLASSPRTSFLNARALLLRLALLLLIPDLAPNVLAQQAPSPSEELLEVVKQLRKQVADLEARTKELEARLGKDTASTATNPAQAKEEAPKEINQDTSVPSPAVDHTGHGGGHGGGGLIGTPLMQIRGFSDVNYSATNVKGKTNTFGLGQLALFVNSRLSDKLNVLAEMAFEANDENEMEFDLERILLQYAVNDYFNLNVGRYHTAIGYYNTAFHHGTWFQTATGRPFLFEFEDDGGILPIHNVGVSVNGHIPSGKLGLSYFAEVGNGRTSRSKLDAYVQNVIDENNGKSLNLGLQARPRWAPGLQVGFNVYRDRLTPAGLPKVGQTIWAAHAIYQTPSFELLNEGVLIRHTLSGTNETIHTPAFYTQISQRFYNRVRPYFRYEYMNVPERDPMIGDVGRRNGPSLGVRYDLGEFAALKLQYQRTANRAQSTSNAVQLQFAFTF
jgi:hypothetical protein